MKANIKYSPKKMWYIAGFVRGMSVDEAVKQLSFLHKKGAEIAKEVILEAQRMAVEEHHVEFKSNLWVGECINISETFVMYLCNITFPKSFNNSINIEEINIFFCSGII